MKRVIRCQIDLGDKVFKIHPNRFAPEASESGEDVTRWRRKIYSDGKKLRVSESNVK